MEKPWLSVIVPSHNGERWLAAALQSVAIQQDDGIEVIVIDASKTDASLKIADSFSDKLRIEAHSRSDLLPWTAKTNFGVEQARGDRICMLHQDDLWLPTRCGEIRKWLSTQSDAVMHLHPCYIVDEAGERLGLWRCPLPAGESPVPAYTLIERLLVQNFVGIPAPTLRRDAFLGVGGLDNALWYTADWDLYLKLAATGSVYYHSSPLACFRVHKGSLTVSGSRNSTDFRNQHQIIVDRHADNLSPQAKATILPIAAASFDLNTALAAAMDGQFTQIGKALVSILMLGPRRIRRYLHYSRIVDRVLPVCALSSPGGFEPMRPTPPIRGSGGPRGESPRALEIFHAKEPAPETHRNGRRSYHLESIQSACSMTPASSNDQTQRVNAGRA